MQVAIRDEELHHQPDAEYGPGAGRPAKLYRCSDRQLDFTLPLRRYALAGHLLALAITAARSAGSERALGRV